VEKLLRDYRGWKTFLDAKDRHDETTYGLVVESQYTRLKDFFNWVQKISMRK
jgi:hypothetical protein